PEVAVSMRGISKAFGGVPVLKEVGFELRRGEIHALVGGNGAGKSTLMKILVGVYSLDSGSYRIGDREVRFGSIADAQAAGVGMVFQEFSLIPTLTVAQNVYMTREPRGFAGSIDDRAMERTTRDIFRSMGVDIPPSRVVGQLPTAMWQLTEIAKALAQDARVLILDEPTAALARTETVQLFDLMRRLRDQGISMIYISHRMEEVFEISDRVTVLRDGRRVLTEPIQEITPKRVINEIVGRKLEHTMEYQARDIREDVLLSVRGLTTRTKLKDVDLELRRGEVLGLAGLMGSGRTELSLALFGVDPVESGDIILDGRRLELTGPGSAIAAGLALIPEDRRLQGLILDHAVRENLLLPLLGRMTRGGFVDDRAGSRSVKATITSLGIRARSPSQPVRTLSGGNQQKVVIGKWLAMKPRVLVMDEPTAGVDVGSKGEILEMIRTFADAGNGVILISSELPELLAVSDRVVILRDGAVERVIGRAEIAHEEDLHHAVQGVA
ncbi:MAG TPA: sugar ABC transporter ATP-binding protein, partial [Candidatus Limnocylindrales bacterium]